MGEEAEAIEESIGGGLNLKAVLILLILFFGSAWILGWVWGNNQSENFMKSYEDGLQFQADKISELKVQNDYLANQLLTQQGKVNAILGTDFFNTTSFDIEKIRLIDDYEAFIGGIMGQAEDLKLNISKLESDNVGLKNNLSSAGGHKTRIIYVPSGGGGGVS